MHSMDLYVLNKTDFLVKSFLTKKFKALLASVVNSKKHMEEKWCQIPYKEFRKSD